MTRPPQDGRAKLIAQLREHSKYAFGTLSQRLLREAADALAAAPTAQRDSNGPTLTMDDEGYPIERGIPYPVHLDKLPGEQQDGRAVGRAETVRRFLTHPECEGENGRRRFSLSSGEYADLCAVLAAAPAAQPEPEGRDADASAPQRPVNLAARLYRAATGIDALPWEDRPEEARRELAQEIRDVAAAVRGMPPPAPADAAVRDLVETVLQRWEHDQRPYQTDEVRGLIAEVRDALTVPADAVRELVEAAFKEGHWAGGGFGRTAEDAWEGSDARRALTAHCPPGADPWCDLYGMGLCDGTTTDEGQPCTCRTSPEPKTGGAG